MELPDRFEIYKEVDSEVRGGKCIFIRDTKAESDQCEIYWVSAIPGAPDTGKPETLVFRSNQDLTIDYSEVCGIPYFSLEDAIIFLDDVLSEKRSYGIMDAPMFADGIEQGVLGVLNTMIDGLPPDYLAPDPIPEPFKKAFDDE